MNNDAKSLGNMDLNFKKDKNVEKKEKTFMFFNCKRCGFHEEVIEKHWIKGNVDNFNLIVKDIHPHYEKIHLMIGDSLNTDGVLCTEYYCGKCKVKGDMLPVPAFALDMFGFRNPDDESFKKSDNKKGSNKSGNSKLLKGLKKLIAKKPKKHSKGGK